MSQARPKECQNELESSMFVDILSQKFFKIPVLSKIKFENNLLPFIHISSKQISKASNKLYRSGETWKPKTANIMVVSASK